MFTTYIFQNLPFSERFLSSASSEIYLYHLPSQIKDSECSVLLDPSPSVRLLVPDVGKTRYFSANLHLERAQFADIIPDSECLVAAIPEFHLFPEQTLPNDKFYQIKLEHCLKSVEERKWLIVRQGCKQTGQYFEKIPDFAEATKNGPFYKVDKQYIVIYTHHFTQFICTVCKKVCEQRARLFIFGSSKHVNDSTLVAVRPYMCSSLYSLDIFRKVKYSYQAACLSQKISGHEFMPPTRVL